MNPKVYGSNYFDKSRSVSSEEIRIKDENKKNIANNYGYKVITLWEYDLKDKQKKEIKEMIVWECQF